VDYHIGNSILKLKASGGDDIISSSPTIEEISIYQDGNYYLDNNLGGLDEILADYSSRQSSLPLVVYSRVSSYPNSMVVQYWFFYAFNEGPLNEHEGDWEMIQIILDSSGSNPVSASYSQHLSGQSSPWGEVEVVDSTHPVVYVALGSHANYFRSYQGNFGFESDTVDANGERISYDAIDLVLLGELDTGAISPSQGWLQFGGRWGDWKLFADALRGTAGPFGPAQGDNSPKWNDPQGWSGEIKSLDTTTLLVNLLVANSIPLLGLFIVVVSAVKIYGIYNARKRNELVISNLLRSGALIGIVLGLVGILLTIGAIISPWYIIQGDITSEEINTDGLVDIILVDGFNGLQINTLQEGQGLTSIFNLAIPFALIMFISVIFSLVDIVGSKSSGKLGSKFIRSGISNLIPVIIIIIFVFQLSFLLSSIDNFGGVAIGPETHEFAEEISSSPIQGEYAPNMQSYGEVGLTWGFGIGSYLFIAAFLVKVIAGLLTKRVRVPQDET
jgi:hypothetical protein